MNNKSEEIIRNVIIRYFKENVGVTKVHFNDLLVKAEAEGYTDEELNQAIIDIHPIYSDRLKRHHWEHWTITDLSRKPKLLKGKDRKTKSGFIYVLDSEHGQKIGRSNNPYYRQERIKIELPFEVSLFALIPTENMVEEEKRLHRLFSTRWLRGEWFKLTLDDLSYLKSLEKVADLPPVSEE